MHTGRSPRQGPERFLRRARIIERLATAEVAGVLLDIAHAAVEVVELAEGDAFAGPAAAAVLLTLGVVHHRSRGRTVGRGAWEGDEELGVSEVVSKVVAAGDRHGKETQKVKEESGANGRNIKWYMSY